MNVFFNPFENRLRSFWRILVVNGAILFSMVFIQVLLRLDTMLFPFLSGLLVMGIIYSLGTKIDLRKASDFGLSSNFSHLKEVFLGTLAAISVMSLLFFSAYFFGWIDIKASLFEGNFLTQNRVFNHLYYFIFMVVVGFYEEIWTRGYLLLNLKEGFAFSNSDDIEDRNLAGSGLSWPIILAVLLSSGFFTFLHIGNPNVNIFATVNIFLAGIVLALPFILTGRLGFSVGLHIGWNYAQGGIFGWAVSGTMAKGNLISVEQIPLYEHINGGAFGPEGGILGTVGLILMLFFSLGWWRSCNATVEV